MSLLAALASLLTAATPPPPAAGWPLPGKELAAYSRVHPGLQLTGGLAVKGIKPGFSFQFWEDHLGKEYRYGPDLLPADPTDLTGVCYLPKTILLVQRSPNGEATVIMEKRALLVRSSEEKEAILVEEEAFLARQQLAARSLVERLQRWWHHGVHNKPYLAVRYDNGQLTIAKGTAQGGQLVELVLAPEFPAIKAESATSSADTRTVSAAVKIIRYLKPYEKLALEDLAPYVTETNFANHRR